MATPQSALPRLPQVARILIVDDHELARLGMRAMALIRLP